MSTFVTEEALSYACIDAVDAERDTFEAVKVAQHELLAATLRYADAREARVAADAAKHVYYEMM